MKDVEKHLLFTKAEMHIVIVAMRARMDDSVHVEVEIVYMKGVF